MDRALSSLTCSCSTTASQPRHFRSGRRMHWQTHSGAPRSLEGQPFKVMAAGPASSRQDGTPYKGVRSFNKSNKLMERMNREIIKEIGRLMPDKNSDPLLDLGDLADPYALPGGGQGRNEAVGQARLRAVPGITQDEYYDALTFGEVWDKYHKSEWIQGLQEQAIDIHHEQRARGTVPSYGQALALGTLMEQMHLEDNPRDEWTEVPPWIRAHFIMEERWGELEAEYQAARDAMAIAESWGRTPELEAKINSYDPELFEGEADAPAEPDMFDSLLEGVLPGTSGFAESNLVQRDYMMDILPEGNDSEEPPIRLPMD